MAAIGRAFVGRPADDARMIRGPGTVPPAIPRGRYRQMGPEIGRAGMRRHARWMARTRATPAIAAFVQDATGPPSVCFDVGGGEEALWAFGDRWERGALSVEGFFGLVGEREREKEVGRGRF